MTTYHSAHRDLPDGVRVMCDGGREVKTVTKTRHAKDVVTREVDDEDIEMLRVPISSTRTDREGDRFSKEALEGMAEQIRSDQPMVFDNHGLAGSWMDAIPYDSRETIGAQMDAELKDREDGETELFALINPDGTHEEGERMLKQVADEKQPLKFSVGFRILNSDPIEDDAGNEIGREFTDVDEMETSRVGIPANPDASASHEVAAKGGGSGELPGYQNHPMMQMLAAMGGGQTAERAAGKSMTPDGGKDCGCGGKESDEAGGPCDDNGDCEEGYVCVDGECVPEEDVDDDDDDEEEEASATDAALEVLASETGRDVDALRADVGLADDDKDGGIPDHLEKRFEEQAEERAAIKESVDDIRESLESGRGDSATGDTSIDRDGPTNDANDDEQDDKTTDADTTPLTERM